MQSRDTFGNYCERLGPGFWDEPLNAWTNLAFAAAAIGVWVLVERAGPGPRRWSIRALAVIIFLIFLGSGAFHTTATRWGAIADTGFIAVYLLYYIVLFAVLFWRMPWRVAALAAPVFIGFTILVGLLTDLVGLRGPGMYLSALLALLGLGGSLHWSKQEDVRPYGAWFAGIGLLFGVSLTLRSLDRELCDSIPVGTHFLWHVFNAAVLFLTAVLAVRRWRQVTDSRLASPDRAA
ncbi:MAG: hypothetical protein ACRDQB_07090 [Thermocrispum sp.]